MRTKAALSAVLVLLLIAAQAAAQAPPRLVRYSGVVRDAHGQPRTGLATLTFSIYAQAEGGAPLWTEVQQVALDTEGRYAVALGATQNEGLPLALFTSADARWLGVRVSDEAEQARILLLSVPYALKAADADTVGGKPASAFVLAGNAAAPTPGVTPTTPTAGGITGATANAPSGAANYIAMFTDTTNINSSVMFQNGTNIGVNTISASAPIHAVSTGAVANTPAAFFEAYSGSPSSPPGVLPGIYRTARGTPAAPAAVQTNDILGGLAVRGYTGTTFSGGQGTVVFKAAENWSDAGKGTYVAFNTTPVGAIAQTEKMRLTGDGKLGIGTTTPTEMLHVTGNAVIDGNIAAKYQDVAEWVAASEPLEAGTIVVVDPKAHNTVRSSHRAYDVGVAGAVSAQPGVVLGEKGEGKALVAQSGRVRIKADARYGAIKAGDLLVTSPTAGYAMKSRPVTVNGVTLHRPGTIVGKALEPLSNGKGEILVLLTLQ